MNDSSQTPASLACPTCRNSILATYRFCPCCGCAVCAAAGGDPASASEGSRLCGACGESIALCHGWCPHCGAAQQDRFGRLLSDYEVALGAQIESARDRERNLVRLWRPASSRLFLFGILLLAVPDAALFLVFQRWLSSGFWQAVGFLLVDVAVGLLAVMLIRACAQRGPAGELILAALRIGQAISVDAAGLMPFGPPHEIFNLILFAVLPLVVMGVAALVFRLHLTDMMDLISLGSVAPPEEARGGGARD